MLKNTIFNTKTSCIKSNLRIKFSCKTAYFWICFIVLEMENEQTNSEAEKQSKCHRDEIERLKVDKKRLEQDLVTETAKLKSLQTELEW